MTRPNILMDGFFFFFLTKLQLTNYFDICVITINIDRFEILINEGLEGSRHFAEGFVHTIFLDSVTKFLSVNFTVLKVLSGLIPTFFFDYIHCVLADISVSSCYSFYHRVSNNRTSAFFVFVSFISYFAET